MQRDGSGCPFWYWENDYEVVLRDMARKGELNKEDYEKVVEVFGECRNEAESSQRKEIHVTGLRNSSDLHLERVVQQLVRLLSAICVLCVCILLVLLGILLVCIVK